MGLYFLCAFCPYHEHNHEKLAGNSLEFDVLILAWNIFPRFGLSRERVRQVGLVAMEKLKHAARRKHLDALLEDYWVEKFFIWVGPHTQWLYILGNIGYIIPEGFTATHSEDNYTCTFVTINRHTWSRYLCLHNHQGNPTRKVGFFFLEASQIFCNICICNGII